LDAPPEMVAASDTMPPPQIDTTSHMVDGPHYINRSVLLDIINAPKPTMSNSKPVPTEEELIQAELERVEKNDEHFRKQQELYDKFGNVSKGGATNIVISMQVPTTASTSMPSAYLEEVEDVHVDTAHGDQGSDDDMAGLINSHKQHNSILNDIDEDDVPTKDSKRNIDDDPRANALASLMADGDSDEDSFLNARVVTSAGKRK
jgi:hypothetical protein